MMSDTDLTQTGPERVIDDVANSIVAELDYSFGHDGDVAFLAVHDTLSCLQNVEIIGGDAVKLAAAHNMGQIALDTQTVIEVPRPHVFPRGKWVERMSDVDRAEYDDHVERESVGLKATAKDVLTEYFPDLVADESSTAVVEAFINRWAGSAQCQFENGVDYGIELESSRTAAATNRNAADRRSLAQYQINTLGGMG